MTRAETAFSAGRAVAAPFVEAEGLAKSFAWRRRGLLRAEARFNAVDGVSLSIAAGEVLGVVGESGCGKSTLGRLVAGLMTPDAGRVRVGGEDLSTLSRPAWRDSRRRIQMVFQDAPGSLDPRLPVRTQVRESLDLHALGTVADRAARAEAMLDAVQLGPHLRDAVPGELSGGQQQRVVIARALILEPALLVCDEPVSALDVSIQAQIMTLLAALRRRMGLTLLFISHDLAVVRQIADRVAVMYLGRIVEEGPADTVLTAPAHPYAQALLAAVPVPDPARDRARSLLPGDPPSPAFPPPGCRFHTRCARAEPRCRVEPPALRPWGEGSVACHLAGPA